MPCTTCMLCLGAFLKTTSCVHRCRLSLKINKLEKSDNKNFVLFKTISSDFKKRMNWDCSNCIYHDTHTLMRIVQKSAIAALTLETHVHRQKSPVSFACAFCSFANSLYFYCSHELSMLCSDWRLQTFMTHASWSIKTTLSQHDDWKVQ